MAYRYLKENEDRIKENVQCREGVMWHTFIREHNQSMYDVDKIYSTSNNKKYGIGFGYDFNNFNMNENYAGATFSTLNYLVWGVIEEFYGVDHSPSQITQIDGLISYHNSSNNVLSKDYSCQFSTNATSGYLRTRWMIGNIDNNNITCYFGLQSGSANNYSL
jgi:hypothetical protein